jgi:hypothetical protein
VRFSRVPNEPESLLLALLPFAASVLFAYAVAKKMRAVAIVAAIGFLLAILLVFSNSR